VVSRKELQDRLWPQDTFVEFENGLNNAISRLREALGDTAESPRFIETVPRHGYRFLAGFAVVPSSRAADFSFRVVSLWDHSGGGPGGWRCISLCPEPQTGDPFSCRFAFPELRTGTADDYFAGGMTDAVTTELAKLGVSKVISETSVAQFKDTKKSVPDIARTLGVDAIVEGAVLREGNQVRITVQLIGADTDRHLWAESYQRQITDVLALQDEVALGVAQRLNSNFHPARRASPLLRNL